jgi:hypothetical protein
MVKVFFSRLAENQQDLGFQNIDELEDDTQEDLVDVNNPMNRIGMRPVFEG